MLNVAASLPTLGTLDVSIGGLRSSRGNVMICLTSAPKHFPNCRNDPTAHRLIVAAGMAQNVIFPDLKPGTYALALIHDENGNGKLDTSLVIPREGFGFSRNPAIAFGPPKFGAAQFAVSTGESAQSIKMKYML
jgi:uncharacterized protein (DUF2141 family)